MARFFFNLVYRAEVAEDIQGSDKPDLAAATATAIDAARDIMASEVKRGVVDLDQRIDILDGSRSRVASISFKETVVFRS